MNRSYTKIRMTALLCSFIFVFSLVLSGCSTVRKMGKNEQETTTDSGVITLGQDSSTTTDVQQVVVDNSGDSFLVDGDDDANVYNHPSAYVTPNQQTSTTTKAPADETDKTVKSTTQATTHEVYNKVAPQRTFGFNKLYDNFSGLANFYLDTIRVYFTYNNKDWLIEFWKGEYAMAAVGCEIGFYNRNHDSLSERLNPDYLHYNSVEDDDAMFASMELWQYVKSSDTEPVKKINFARRRCWWAADFQTGVLEKHSDRTSLVMRGSVEFPNTEMMNLFIKGLEERGFKKGSTDSYKSYERYSVSGKKVTVNWRYYDEDRFQDSKS